MTREELKEHCQRQIQQFERVGKIMPVTPNDWKRYEEHKLILELLEQEPKTGHWITQWNGIHQKEYYYCSECREEFSYDGETGIKMNDYDFCPNCGAEMSESKYYAEMAKSFVKGLKAGLEAESEDKQMNKLEKAKEVIKEHYGEACCGIFDCRNTVGDPMSTLYEDDDLTIDICYGYMYFEVFGLSETEFAELEEYYYSLGESEE